MGVPSRARRFDDDRVQNKAQTELDEEGEEKEPVKSVYVAKLQPFAFTAEQVPEQQELQKEAEGKVWLHSSEALKNAKDVVTKALQDALDEANEQLARGEAISRRAQFPLLNPVHFKDLGALADHDFTIDVHIDVVDDALKQIVAEVLQLVWHHVTIENMAKSRMLERYNEALLSRMETLDHHLSDRSKQLSSCRFAYFLEITHLRNQVYKKFLEGDEFEPVEAYFFDPTEYLEEDLRLMLNDKIKMSCRTYHRRVMELKRHCEDLELKLESALQNYNPNKGGHGLNEMLQITCHRHGRKSTVFALQQFAEKEMMDWAEKLILKRERLMADAAREELKEVRSELENKTHETQHTRVCLKKAIDELHEEQMRLEEVEQQMAQLRAEKIRLEDLRYGAKMEFPPTPKEEPEPVVETIVIEKEASVDPADAEALEQMRTRMAKLQQQLEQEQDKREDADMQLRMMTDRQEAMQRTIEQMAQRSIAAQSRPAPQPVHTQSPTKASAPPKSSATVENTVAQAAPVLPVAAQGIVEDALQQASFNATRIGIGGTTPSLRESFNLAPSEDVVSRQDDMRVSNPYFSEEQQVDGPMQLAEFEHFGVEHSRGEQPSLEAIAAEDSRREAEASTVLPKPAAARTGLKGASFAPPEEKSRRGSAVQGLGMSLELFKEVQQEHLRLMQQDRPPTAAGKGQPAAESSSQKHQPRSASKSDSKVLSKLPARKGKPQRQDSKNMQVERSTSRSETVDAGQGSSFARGSPLSNGQSASDKAWSLVDEDDEDLLSNPFPGMDLKQGVVEAQQLADWFRKQLSVERTLRKRLAQQSGTVAVPESLEDKYVQTAIATDPSKTGFYMYDLPDTEMENAVRQELADLQMCQDGAWQSALGSIRACYNPPVGVGPGTCRRAAFLRLFLGCRDRIQRQTELANLCEQVRRAELHRVLQGVNFLMESALPDSDGELREAIFGRGFTTTNLEAKGEEFASVSRKWRRQLAAIINILSERPDDVQLGAHVGRRIYVNTGVAASTPLPGGAGGGLAARQRKNADPVSASRPQYPGLVLEDEEDRVTTSLDHDATKATFRSPAEEPDVDMAKLLLKGKPALQSQETLALVNAEIGVQGGPYLIQPAAEMSPRGPETTAPFVMERAGMAAQPLSLDLLYGDPQDTIFLAELLGATPDDLRVVAQRLSSRPKRVLTASRAPAVKEPSASTQVCSSLADGPRGHSQHARRVSGEARQARSSLQASQQLTQPHESRSLPLLSSVSMSSTFPAHGETAANQQDAGTDILQANRFRPSWSAHGCRAPAACDMEEPQAEPAPSRPQSGAHRSNAVNEKSDREREIERLRQTLCTGGLPRGPIPSVDFYKSQEYKPTRPVGGRHTKQERWLVEKKGNRSASAGRMRPVDPRGEAGPKPGSAPAGLFGTGRSRA